MHEYDVALKLILQQSVDLAIRELTGTTIARWLNIELPEIQNTRVDLLGETPSGELLHMELQSTNKHRMALRMAQYYLRVYRKTKRFPQQILVYVGNAPLRMRSGLQSPTLQYSYTLVDIRDLDGVRLLESSYVGDNIVGLLTRLPSLRTAAQQVLEKISRLPPEERETTLRQLLILAGLRQAEEMIEEEAKKMPLLNEILDNAVLGREFKRGLKEGVKEGFQQGELTLLRRLIEKRFGALPAWAEQKIAALSSGELEALGLRVLDAGSLEDLLPPATV